MLTGSLCESGGRLGESGGRPGESGGWLGESRGRPGGSRGRPGESRGRLGESGGRPYVSGGRLCLARRSSVRWSYTRVIDATTVVRRCRSPGCGLAVSIGCWRWIGTSSVRWGWQRWSVNLLGLDRSRATVERRTRVGVTRKSRAVSFSTKKVVDTNANGSQRNEREEQRDRPHVERGKDGFSRGSGTNGYEGEDGLI